MFNKVVLIYWLVCVDRYGERVPNKGDSNGVVYHNQCLHLRQESNKVLHTYKILPNHRKMQQNTQVKSYQDTMR